MGDGRISSSMVGESKGGEEWSRIYTLVALIMAVFFLPISGFSAIADEAKEKRLIQNNTVSIGGTYRLRGEIADEFNVKKYGTGDRDDFLLSRLRLEIDITVSKTFTLHAQIQDAEVLGSSFSDRDFKGGNNPFHDPFDINQLYIEYWPVEEYGIKVGRQPISFGDRRIFGPGDWGNTGRYAWDAIRVMYKSSVFDCNLLTGRFILHDPDVWPNEQINGVTAFAAYNTVRTLPFQLDLFYVLKYDDRGVIKGEKSIGNLSSHYAGFRIDGKKGQVNYDSTIVKEFGKWASDTINAYGVVLTLGYTFDTLWKPNLIMQYVNGSGDRDPSDGEHGTFDGVFGGADTVLYGWMNLFFFQNIREHRLDLILTPSETMTLRGEYHYFMLDKAKDAWYSPSGAQRRDKGGDSGRELGHEVDLTAKKRFSNDLELLCGYSFFIPGEFVKKTGSSPTAHWWFFQTTVFF
ncbi:MAG: alginate export family protein [Candidatus Methanomethylicaceae archaeon]